LGRDMQPASLNGSSRQRHVERVGGQAGLQGAFFFGGEAPSVV